MQLLRPRIGPTTRWNRLTLHNEATWTDHINSMFEGITARKMKAVFIDTYFDVGNTTTEREEFEKNTRALFEFAVEKDPFPCKDIKQVKHEWRTAMEELANITSLNKVLQSERDSLTEKINRIEDEKRKLQTPVIEPSIETSSMSSILVTVILTLLAFVFGVLGSFWYKSFFDKQVNEEDDSDDVDVVKLQTIQD